MKITNVKENKDGSLTAYANFTHEELQIIVKKFFADSILDAIHLLDKKAKTKKKIKARR